MPEESLWASGLAARLRLIQANFADQAAGSRQGYLLEEIERALKDINPSKRKAHLDALGEHFPAWEATAPAPVVTVEGTPETPDELLSRFIDTMGKLSTEEKSRFKRKLAEAGLLEVQASTGTVDLPGEMRRKLNLTAEQPIHAERATKLLGGLLEVTLALDQLAWALWKQMAPKSVIRKEGDFAKLVGPYLAGDAEVATAQVAGPLEKTRKLIASLLGAVGRAGSTYAKRHVGRFAPEVIKDLAQLEKKMWENIEPVAWRKYEQLAREHASEPALESEIQDAIVKAAEMIQMGRMAG
jgi:hypothetical protein